MSSGSRSTLTTVGRLLEPGKGMIAPDEHHDRLARALRIDQADPMTTSRHRLMVLTTPGLKRWVSAVVFEADALRTGVPERRPDDPIHGVRLGTGTDVYPYGDNQTAVRRSTEMRDELARLHDQGIAFVKWRADLDPIVGGADSYVDTSYLARCAALSQEAELVPVLDVAMPNQRTHSLGVAIAVTANALGRLYRELAAQGVDLAGVVVRMNMVRAGIGHAEQTTPDAVGSSTLRVLRTSVPDEAPGVMFMSTGMECAAACADLAAITDEAARSGWDRPITFGFGNALLARATRTWARDGEAAAQAALAEDCEAASAAASGRLIGA